MIRNKEYEYLPIRFTVSGFGDIYHSNHSLEYCSKDFSIPRKPGSLSSSVMLSQLEGGNQALLINK